MSETLSSRSLLVAAAVLLAASGSAACASAQEATGEGAAQEPTAVEVPVEGSVESSGPVEHKRMPLPSLSHSVDHPFTIEVPVNWGPRRSLPAPGIFLGPPSGTPDSHPEMLLIRESDVALDAPEAILSNLRSHAEAADWSLREAEVRDFGGVRGLWIVRDMPPEGFHGRRVSFAVKLPIGDRSLDVAATVPAEQYDSLAPRIEYMLRSLRPAEEAAGEEPPEPQD